MAPNLNYVSNEPTKAYLTPFVNFHSSRAQFAPNYRAFCVCPCLHSVLSALLGFSRLVSVAAAHILSFPEVSGLIGRDFNFKSYRGQREVTETQDMTGGSSKKRTTSSNPEVKSSPKNLNSIRSVRARGSSRKPMSSSGISKCGPSPRVASIPKPLLTRLRLEIWNTYSWGFLCLPQQRMTHLIALLMPLCLEVASRRV